MKPEITVAIQNSGRMCIESLEWLADIGIVERSWQQEACYLIGNAKKKQGEDEIKNEIMELWNSRKNGITLKYDLRSGYRASFLAKEEEIEGIPVLIYGSEPPTTNIITQSLGEIAIIGFDELLAAFVPYLQQDKKITGWEEFNSALRPLSTDAQYIGLTGIEDYAGLFLIASPKRKIEPDYLEQIIRGMIPVAVKGQNEGLLYYLLGDNVLARPTNDIEQEVQENSCFGFDIVRTGSTVESNKLVVVGEPILCTKSVVVVDKKRYSQNNAVRKAANYLVRTPDNPSALYAWKAQLEETLGEKWLK